MYRHYNDILSAKLREYFEEDMLFMSVSLLTEELALVAVPRNCREPDRAG